MRSLCYSLDTHTYTHTHTHTHTQIKETELGFVSFNLRVPKLGILYSLYLVYSPYPGNSTTFRVNINFT